MIFDRQDCYGCPHNADVTTTFYILCKIHARKLTYFLVDNSALWEEFWFRCKPHELEKRWDRILSTFLVTWVYMIPLICELVNNHIRFLCFIQNSLLVKECGRNGQLLHFDRRSVKLNGSINYEIKI